MLARSAQKLAPSFAKSMARLRTIHTSSPARQNIEHSGSTSIDGTINLGFTTLVVGYAGYTLFGGSEYTDAKMRQIKADTELKQVQAEQIRSQLRSK